MSNQALEPLVEVDPSNFDDEDFENRDATWEDLGKSCFFRILTSQNLDFKLP